MRPARDACMGALQGMPVWMPAWEAGIGACNIDDDLLKAIRVLPNLEHLEIQGTNVSGDGLAYLTPMKQLRYLDLTDTKVTPSGIQHLKTQRPNLSIVHESLPP